VFDFAGCGQSEGEYITLGYQESRDLMYILNHLRKQHKQINNIVIWGRSMGAVTALLYAQKCPKTKFIKGIIVDSPFSSLKKLA
jgi:alpha/beta superfamily hydrolase